MQLQLNNKIRKLKTAKEYKSHNLVTRRHSVERIPPAKPNNVLLLVFIDIR